MVGGGFVGDVVVFEKVDEKFDRPFYGVLFFLSPVPGMLSWGWGCGWDV